MFRPTLLPIGHCWRELCWRGRPNDRFTRELRTQESTNLDGKSQDVTEARLLTAQEVAALLSVPVSWIREHTRSGRLPHIPLGRYKRYRREAILEWLEANEHVGQFRRYQPTLRER